jgi:hypothetical protein
VTGELQKCCLSLRKRSPSGTERVRIGDPVIFLICSKGLAQYLVQRSRPATRLDVSVNPTSTISRFWYLPSAPNWEFMAGFNRPAGMGRTPASGLTFKGLCPYTSRLFPGF